MLDSAQLENLRVVLVAPRNPLNIGAAARAMSNFGFSRLRVVNPYELAFREARSAVGAAPLLAAAEEFETVAAAVSDCSLVIGTTGGRDREFKHEFHTVQEGAREIVSQLKASPVALLFGSEKRGLANEDLSYCHWLMHVPTASSLSMNLGQAVAVCLYELSRSEKASISEPRRRARSAELDRLTSVLQDLLVASGYVNLESATSSEEKLRRMIRRFDLSPTDAEVLLGMLRQVAWKIGQRDDGGKEN